MFSGHDCIFHVGPVHDWRVRGCNKFISVLGGNGTKIAPTGDIFVTPWSNAMNSKQACRSCRGSCSPIPGTGCFGDLPGDEIVVSPPSPIVEPLVEQPQNECQQIDILDSLLAESICCHRGRHQCNAVIHACFHPTQGLHLKADLSFCVRPAGGRLRPQHIAKDCSCG